MDEFKPGAVRLVFDEGKAVAVRTAKPERRRHWTNGASSVQSGSYVARGVVRAD